MNLSEIFWIYYVVSVLLMVIIEEAGSRFYDDDDLLIVLIALSLSPIILPIWIIVKIIGIINKRIGK